MTNHREYVIRVHPDPDDKGSIAELGVRDGWWDAAFAAINLAPHEFEVVDERELPPFDWTAWREE